GLLKYGTKASPVLLVAQGKLVRTHGLVNVEAQRRLVALDHARHFGKAQIVRLHDYSDEGDRDPQPDAACCLIMDQRPIAGTALATCLRSGGLTRKDCDLVKG